MDNSFRQRYLAVAEDLLLQLPGDPGLAADDISTAQDRLGVTLPASLLDYLLAVGKLDLNTAHNRLLPLHTWFMDDGKLVFMEENQRVVFWGINAFDTPDPPVLQGVNLYPDPIEWHPEQERLSAFLVITLHFQAAMGGLEQIVSARVLPSKVSEFESQWRSGGESNGLIAFRRKGQVVCFFGSREDANLEMFAGAVSDAAYRQLMSTLAAMYIEFDEF